MKVRILKFLWDVAVTATLTVLAVFVVGYIAYVNGYGGFSREPTELEREIFGERGFTPGGSSSTRSGR